VSTLYGRGGGERQLRLAVVALAGRVHVRRRPHQHRLALRGRGRSAAQPRAGAGRGARRRGAAQPARGLPSKRLNTPSHEDSVTSAWRECHLGGPQEVGVVGAEHLLGRDGLGEVRVREEPRDRGLVLDLGHKRRDLVWRRALPRAGGPGASARADSTRHQTHSGARAPPLRLREASARRGHAPHPQGPSHPQSGRRGGGAAGRRGGGEPGRRRRCRACPA